MCLNLHDEGSRKNAVCSGFHSKCLPVSHQARLQQTIVHCRAGQEVAVELDSEAKYYDVTLKRPERWRSDSVCS